MPVTERLMSRVDAILGLPAEDGPHCLRSSGPPGDGVLHPKNNLDTLGADAPEKLCKRN